MCFPPTHTLIQLAEKSRANLAKEKEIEILADGLQQQHTSHHKMDLSRLAHKRPGNDQVGVALDQTTTTNKSGLTTTTLTSSAMETTSDADTPGASGMYEVIIVKHYNATCMMNSFSSHQPMYTTVCLFKF